MESIADVLARLEREHAARLRRAGVTRRDAARHPSTELRRSAAVLAACAACRRSLARGDAEGAALAAYRLHSWQPPRRMPQPALVALAKHFEAMPAAVAWHEAGVPVSPRKPRDVKAYLRARPHLNVGGFKITYYEAADRIGGPGVRPVALRSFVRTYMATLAPESPIV